MEYRWFKARDDVLTDASKEGWRIVHVDVHPPIEALMYRDTCIDALRVPVATMRRALALAEQHDPDLAADLRASEVSP